MDERQARDLAERLRRLVEKRAGVEELHGDEATDFVFVADRSVLVGSFKISAPNLTPFFVSIASGSDTRQRNFQVLFMEKRRGSPMLATSRHQGGSLLWRYNPTKRSGDNAKRKEAFVRRLGADSISFPLPDSDVEPFAEKVLQALALRREADAAGGDDGSDPEEAGDDDDVGEGIAYWKIAPGELGSEWDRCRERKVIVIGWKELGDLSGIDEQEFDRRVEAAPKELDWGTGVAQAWKFRNIRIGDRIVANAGTKRVLGIGTVTGPYGFVADDEYPHQLPVRWDDTQPRSVDMPGWRRTLVRLTQGAFNALTEAPLTSTVAPTAPEPVAAPSGGIDFEGVIAQLESCSLSFPAELLASYLLALQARRFVLLTGISGTGKTQLALEVAKVFSPRGSSSETSDGAQVVVAPDMLKRARFVVPAALAKEFDVLSDEAKRRVDVRLLGGPLESMAVYKDASRPSLLIVLLSGETRRNFQTSLSRGERLVLRRDTRGAAEILVVERAGAAPSPTAPSYELVAVRPDWTDSRALLGFYNPLMHSYTSTPTLDLVLRAREEVALAEAEHRAPRPFFLIFDEMNLARVEHYFSDFLSAMESRQDLPLHDDDDIEEIVPRRIDLPQNLFVIGTVNVDETTYMFSPKVLDRAFVLEFNEVDLELLSGRAASEDPSSTVLALTKLEGGLKLMGRATDEEWLRFEAAGGGKLRTLLARIHTALAEENRHFGYRAAREIARFVVLAAEQTSGAEDALLASFDIAILAKVLPKLNGTHAELDGPLRRLFEIAVGGTEPLNRECDSWTVVSGELRTAGGQRPQLERTAKKLWRMQKRLRANGFVSFME